MFCVHTHKQQTPSSRGHCPNGAAFVSSRSEGKQEQEKGPVIETVMLFAVFRYANYQFLQSSGILALGTYEKTHHSSSYVHILWPGVFVCIFFRKKGLTYPLESLWVYRYRALLSLEKFKIIWLHLKKVCTIFHVLNEKLFHSSGAHTWNIWRMACAIRQARSGSLISKIKHAQTN